MLYIRGLAPAITCCSPLFTSCCPGCSLFFACIRNLQPILTSHDSVETRHFRIAIQQRTQGACTGAYPPWHRHAAGWLAFQASVQRCEICPFRRDGMGTPHRRNHRRRRQ
ncbi:MAG: hypothetical protein DME40_12360, partial [Verrucomicrobia bacterium]